MTIEHIVDVGYLVIEPLHDPREDSTWMPSGTNDLLAYATPILGPTATLIVHRFGCYFAAGHTWHQFDLEEFAATFGGNASKGVNAPILRSLQRIDRFGFGELSPIAPRVRIRPAIPPLSRGTARRIPADLAEHCPYIVR